MSQEVVMIVLTPFIIIIIIIIIFGSPPFSAEVKNDWSCTSTPLYALWLGEGQL
jgi:hypothetical protein